MSLCFWVLTLSFLPRGTCETGSDSQAELVPTSTTPTTSHPRLKQALQPLCSLFPADQWDPDKSSATKEPSFLGNFSQLVQKKSQRENVYSWFVSRTERQFRIVWEEGRARRKRERDGEGERRRLDTYRMRGKKKGVAVFGICSCPQDHFSQRIKSDILKKNPEKHEAVGSLSGMIAMRKPQHRGIVGNHRCKLPDRPYH